MQKLTKSNFSVAWDGIGTENEMVETYSLTQIATLAEAVKLIIDHLGMNPSERTDSVDDEKSTHALLLTGTYYFSNCFSTHQIQQPILKLRILNFHTFLTN